MSTHNKLCRTVCSLSQSHRVSTDGIAVEIQCAQPPSNTANL